MVGWSALIADCLILGGQMGVAGLLVEASRRGWRLEAMEAGSREALSRCPPYICRAFVAAA